MAEQQAGATERQASATELPNPAHILRSEYYSNCHADICLFLNPHYYFRKVLLLWHFMCGTDKLYVYQLQIDTTQNKLFSIHNWSLVGHIDRMTNHMQSQSLQMKNVFLNLSFYLGRVSECVGV